MAKANKKASKKEAEAKQKHEQAIRDGFDKWEKTLDQLVASAERSFMPLLAENFRFAKRILSVYKESYKDYFEKGSE